MKTDTANGIIRFVRFLVWMIILGIIIFLVLAVLNNYYDITNGENITIMENITQIQSPSYLETLLQKEIVNNPNWTCKDYMIYYNQSLRKYNLGLTPLEKNLDIREVRYMDVCNGLTLCGSYHTFLVVGGYGSYCILDAQDIKCITLLEIGEIKSNEEKKE